MSTCGVIRDDFAVAMDGTMTRDLLPGPGALSPLGYLVAVGDFTPIWTVTGAAVRTASTSPITGRLANTR